MSLDKLLKLAECAALPPDCKDWLVNGVGRYVEGTETLDDCLGVSTADSVQMAEIRRDRYLRRAAKCLDENLKPWPRAVRLVKEINLFETVIWPRWKLKPDPPADASDLRKHLFHARRYKSLPLSERHIHRIITS